MPYILKASYTKEFWSTNPKWTADLQKATMFESATEAARVATQQCIGTGFSILEVVSQPVYVVTKEV